MLPVLNLGVKRFHDMNKPSRWALMVLIPLFGWIMPALFKGENENNVLKESNLSFNLQKSNPNL